MVTTTLQPTNQCPRPADCPACVRNTQEACGIKTVTASQIGAVAALVVGGIFFALQVVFPSSPLPSQNSLLPQEGGFADEFWVILCISAVYYAVAEWDAEECRYHELRLVQWPTFMKWNWLRTKPLAKLSYWEFWIRVGLAATFGAAAAGVPEYLRFGMTEVHSSCLLLAWIYVGFLFWDVLILEGGKPELVGGIAFLDFLGVVLILACLWLHGDPTRPHLGNGVPIIALIVSVVLLTVKLTKMSFFSRMSPRQRDVLMR